MKSGTKAWTGSSLVATSFRARCHARLTRLSRLHLPVPFIHGNGELAVLVQMRVTDPAAVT
jgi:hypothetical protein